MHTGSFQGPPKIVYNIFRSSTDSEEKRQCKYSTFPHAAFIYHWAYKVWKGGVWAFFLKICQPLGCHLHLYLNEKGKKKCPQKHFWLRNRVSSLYSLQHQCHRFYFHYNVLTAEALHYKLIEELPKDRRKMPLLKHMGRDLISMQDLAILIRFLI